MEEKRRFLRFETFLKGEVEFEGTAGFIPGVDLLDFSRQGLRVFVSKDAFSRAGSLKLRVYLPQREIPMFIRATVKWIRPKGEGWEEGAEIDELNPMEKNEILEYAYKTWKEKQTRIK